MTTVASNSVFRPNRIRDYRTLSRIPDYQKRFEYLKLDGSVGNETFGFDRYLNQRFYHSDEWRSVRDYVIARDLGNDMGLDGYPIKGQIHIHHMNPISIDDILSFNDSILNPDYLVCVSKDTHKAIHYGNSRFCETKDYKERTPYDTCPWKKGK